MQGLILCLSFMYDIREASLNVKGYDLSRPEAFIITLCTQKTCV